MDDSNVDRRWHKTYNDTKCNTFAQLIILLNSFFGLSVLHMNVLASQPGINTPISTLTLDLFGLIENLLQVGYTLKPYAFFVIFWVTLSL